MSPCGDRAATERRHSADPRGHLHPGSGRERGEHSRVRAARRCEERPGKTRPSAGDLVPRTEVKRSAGRPRDGGRYGRFTYPCRAFDRKYFSKAILAACDCGPGIITPCLRGGSILSARMMTPLFPASMMHTAGMSPKFSSFLGSSPRICDAMFSAATWAIVSAGKPVLGTPTAFAVAQGAFTAA